MICVHAFVSGKVQGVCFRDYTQKHAQALRLTGWVRNLPDGRVETIVTGPETVVMDFIERLKKGSPSSKVQDVCWEKISQQTHADFTII